MAQQDMKVSELVSKMEKGEIKLPEMQRRYVWTQTRVRDLLDSLYRGYPSGSILVWEPDDTPVIRDTQVEQTNESSRYQLLLDGQQRLTSLTAITTGEPIKVKDRKNPIDILFNMEHPEGTDITAETSEFSDSDTEDADDSDIDAEEVGEGEIHNREERMTFAVSNNRLAKLPHWVSVTEVFQETSDKDFLRAAGVTEMDDPRYDKYTKRLKKLRGIQDYQYRVDILSGKSYEEVTEIFVRVNSLGAKLSGSDLALAQITAKWNGSLALFEEFQDEIREAGFDLDLGVHLRNMIASATGQATFKAVAGLSKEQLQEGWRKSIEGMQFAISFLRANLNIYSPALLSSPSLIVTLAQYGNQNDNIISDEQADQLGKWILSASVKRRYTRGATESFIDQDLQAIKEGRELGELMRFLETQVGRLGILPGDLEGQKKGSAYFKTMFLAFRALGARNWSDGLVIALDHTGAKHSIQAHHIFPQAVLKGRGLEPKHINDICNLAFIGGELNREISNKPPSEYLPAIAGDRGIKVLENQSIPTDPKLWELDAYEDFLEARRVLVAKCLNEFLGHNTNGPNLKD